jgi:hypothetical protein
MGMSLGITEELIAGQPPEAQAIIRLLWANIAKLEAELQDLRRAGAPASGIGLKWVWHSTPVTEVRTLLP